MTSTGPLAVDPVDLKSVRYHRKKKTPYTYEDTQQQEKQFPGIFLCDSPVAAK
jgi:hypothetical protein